MNNYQNKAREEILDFITVRCKDCAGLMERFYVKGVGFYCPTCKREIVLTRV
jgi:ribosomal protein S27E